MGDSSLDDTAGRRTSPLASVAAAPVHRHVEAQAARRPSAVAVVQGQRFLTYSALNVAANRLAHHLRSLGVGPDTLVALLLDRSPELIVAQLAVWKAGGAFVGVDPTQPPARIEMVLDDCSPPVLLTRPHLATSLPERPWIVLDVEAASSPDSPFPETDLLDEPAPGDLAYVIYTSGTTGAPNGVLIEHGSLAHYIDTASDLYAVTEHDRVLQFTSIVFDASLESIYVTLTRGAELVLRTEDMLLTVERFVEESRRLAITVWELPTAFWHHLALGLCRADLSVPSSVRLTIIGGEKALPDRLRAYRERTRGQSRLINTYGPTEATIAACAMDLDAYAIPAGATALPVGPALPGVVVEVLGEDGQEVPTGARGEVYLGGVGLARGYLRRPHLTAQRFVETPRGRRYRTGDVGSLDAGGVLTVLGRTDAQVKVRGYRVEMGEVEAALRRHPFIEDAVAVTVPDGAENLSIVAYVVPVAGEEALSSTWRGHMRSMVPGYIVPARFVALSKLPVTANGKVDRRSLEDLAKKQDPSAEAAPVGDAVQARVLALWRSVLGQEHIHLDDGFFDLGGDSMSAARLAVAMKEAFGFDVPLRWIYVSPTPRGAAELLRAAPRGARDPYAATLTDVRALPVRLAGEIGAHGRPSGQGGETGHLFLTGATGFVGAFLLEELLRSTAASVHCLVRCGSPAEGMARLRSVFAKHHLEGALLDGRVVVEPGDLGRPLLGLSEERFGELSGSLDRIYHSGAGVNFVKPYSALEAVNVGGTHEVLRLACRRRVTPVCHVSTVSVFGAMAYFTGGRSVAEGTPLSASQDFLRWDDGYSQSKWMAERLVEVARARGVPVTIVRPGFVAGHRQSGAANGGDFLARMIQGCAQLGLCPALRGAKHQIVPVDYVAQAICHLGERVPAGGTYHLTPWCGEDDLELDALFDLVRAQGHALRELPYEEWVSELRGRVDRGERNALAPLLPLLTEKIFRGERTVLELYQHCADFDSSRAQELLRPAGIARPSYGEREFRAYLSFLIEEGYLAPPVVA
jgi:amino acid adenylation domain-containing protein/thioester reductase-like protein